jgi:hypothetical protein
MPWAFLAVLLAIGATTTVAVILGEDMDGSKAFVSTAVDQQSLMAFAANAMMIAGLFGATAVAREYGHDTVVPTFLATPRRYRAVLAQLTAVFIGGGLLGLVGAGLTVGAVVVGLPSTGYAFMVSAGDVARVLLAAAFTGAVGAVLGAGIGALVRNTGGAVTGAFLLLVVAPPLAMQLASGTASWVPSSLANVLSGVGDQVTVMAAFGALAAWAVIPAVVGLISVQRRDVI